jgi:hypothetical protein
MPKPTTPHSTAQHKPTAKYTQHGTKWYRLQPTNIKHTQTFSQSSSFLPAEFENTFETHYNTPRMHADNTSWRRSTAAKQCGEQKTIT